MKIGVVKRRGNAPPGLSDDFSDQGSLCIRKGQNLFFKKTHTGRITGKGNNYNIRGMISGCRQVVKFVGTVKNYLTVSKNMNFFICLNPGSSFIYTLKFPEIMLFTRIGKVIAVFKVMDGINFFYRKIFGKRYTFIYHNTAAP